MKRIVLLPLAWLAAASLGCSRGPSGGAPREATSLAEAVRPAFFARALRQLGGGHYHGTARLTVGAAGEGSVTTTTDLWLDRAGNWRLAETNDRDGGRDVVLVGRELFVALRYGKMIHRVAEEPEPTTLLEQALGGPWAAWEIARAWTAIERVGATSAGGRPATESRVARATARHDEGPAAAPTGLRAWRATATVEELSGRALVDDATGALLAVDLAARFTAQRDGHDLPGAVDVHGALDGVASTPPVTAPPSEALALRQRLVPEQRELLGGLPSTRGLPGPATPPRMKVPVPLGTAPKLPPAKGPQP